MPPQDIEMEGGSGRAARKKSRPPAPFALFKDGCYPRLANLMTYGDMAVFRKFGAMNHYILLSLQSELVELEQRLQHELLNRDHLDNESQEFTEDVDGEFEKFRRNFHFLRDNVAKAAKDSSGPGTQQNVSPAVPEGKESSSKASVLQETVPAVPETKAPSKASALQQSAVHINDRIAEIKEKLEQYNNFLLLFSEVSNLRSAKKSDLVRLREWLRGEGKGEGGMFLARTPFESKTWGEEFLDDDFLLLDSGSDDKDLFSRDVSPLVINAARRMGFNKLKTPIDESGTVVYSGLTPFLKVFTTSLAAILPAVSILGLYYCSTMALRIGVMIIITFTFSIILSVFTSANRIEIFSATAAFAAVEVVFIGSATLRDS